MAMARPEEFHELYVHAMNSGDLEAIAALYEPNARFISKLVGPIVGAMAIRNHYKSLLELKGRIEEQTTSVSKVEDLALLRSAWTFSGTKGGVPVELSGESIEVLRRQPDGTWRVVIDLPYGSE